MSKAARDFKREQRRMRRFYRELLAVIKASNRRVLGELGSYRIADAGTDAMRVERA